MRLLNTKTIVLESFPSPATPEIPEYVILSHRWRDQDQEVSFLDIQQRKAGDPVEPLRDNTNYSKILSCCDEARRVGFEYIWIDTCCINKTDQIELTEALNSMFHWYRDSAVCYAYMSDVPSNEDPLAEGSKFTNSKWFTRGWTLQELVAPQYITFFGEDWKEIGTKSSFQALITKITGIPDQVLLTNSGGSISVAQRMSWVAKRETTVEEDMAYCLLGLFNVTMPMAYGEGANAFRRLQLEIMKVSDDHTIFAWAGTSQGESRGLLAASPREFADCADVKTYGESPAFSMTNKGMTMKIPLIEHSESPEGNQIFQGILSCQRKGHAEYPDRFPMATYLERHGGADSTRYSRVHPGEIEEIEEDVSKIKKTKIYVREPDPSSFDVSSWMKQERSYHFIFTIKPHPKTLPAIEFADIKTGSNWVVTKDEINLTFPNSGCNSILIFKSRDHGLFAISLGVHNYNVWGAMTVPVDADIKRIAWAYWDGEFQLARWDNMDRRKLELGKGQVATLAIRRGRRNGGKVYLIEVDAGEHFWLDKVGPGNFPGWWDPEKNEKVKNAWTPGSG